MSFPSVERVVYVHSPLVEVISQLRFPPILKIDSDSPTEFQDRIRVHYPYYEIRIEENFLPPEFRRIVPAEIVEMFTTQTRSRVHDFIDEERGWRLSLSKDFIALSTNHYTGWTAFRTFLANPVTAFGEQYSPAFYVRIGLRYRNLIQRSKIGLTGVPWAELLQAYIANPLGAPGVDEADVLNVVHRIEMRLADGQSQVRIVHGFQAIDGENCYLIDSDLFSEQKIEVDDALDRLDYLNGAAGRVFRWCITDRLHFALEPTAPRT